ncbi:MAG: hypothetical protein NT069_31225 [Planctomycetota bacterium]|nr:hypothetical protein [Planctomycetota bacterium]
MAQEAGFLKLTEMFFDGTRVKANNSRHETWTAEKIEKAIAELGKEFDAALEEFAKNDQSRTAGPQVSDFTLPPNLADLKERQKLLKKIQQKVQEADAIRKKEGVHRSRRSVEHGPRTCESSVLTPCGV